VICCPRAGRAVTSPGEGSCPELGERCRDDGARSHIAQRQPHKSARLPIAVRPPVIPGRPGISAPPTARPVPRGGSGLDPGNEVAGCCSILAIAASVPWPILFRAKPRIPLSADQIPEPPRACAAKSVPSDIASPVSAILLAVGLPPKERRDLSNSLFSLAISAACTFRGFSGVGGARGIR
jgi:hypothetical protein